MPAWPGSCSPSDDDRTHGAAVAAGAGRCSPRPPPWSPRSAAGVVVVLQDDEPIPPRRLRRRRHAPEQPPAPTTTAAPADAGAPTTTAAPSTSGFGRELPRSAARCCSRRVSPPSTHRSVDDHRLNAVRRGTGGVVVLDVATEHGPRRRPRRPSRTVPLDVVPSSLVAAGPGDVVYGLLRDAVHRRRIDGRRDRPVRRAAPAGRRLAPPIDIEPLPRAPGRCASARPDRDRRPDSPGREQLIGYVDTAGQPLDWPDAPAARHDRREHTVRSTDGA